MEPSEWPFREKGCLAVQSFYEGRTKSFQGLITGLLRQPHIPYFRLFFFVRAFDLPITVGMQWEFWQTSHRISFLCQLYLQMKRTQCHIERGERGEGCCWGRTMSLPERRQTNRCQMRLKSVGWTGISHRWHIILPRLGIMSALQCFDGTGDKLWMENFSQMIQHLPRVERNKDNTIYLAFKSPLFSWARFSIIKYPNMEINPCFPSLSPGACLWKAY